jgi:hypothetical protein
MFRKVGHRMYRTKYLKTALKLIPENYTQIRPEYKTLQLMQSEGFPSKEITNVFGIHDFEQYYCDIYRKAFVYANKHQVWLPKICTRWKNKANNDQDYKIALRGLYDGLLATNSVKIDTRAYGDLAKEAMNELGFSEKSNLHPTEMNAQLIETILSKANNKYDLLNANSFEAKKSRLKRRYKRLGMLRFAPYILGSLLVDIGTNLKRYVDRKY